jgi:hypothetical protein
MKKLLLIGSNCVHTYNYFHLIKDYFDEIVLITDAPHDVADFKISKSYQVNSSLKSLRNYPKAIRAYKKILQEERPDIIHIQQISTYSFLLLRALKKLKQNIPVVLTTWGSDILVFAEKGMDF